MTAKLTWDELQRVWLVQEELAAERRRLFDLQQIDKSTNSLLDGLPRRTAKSSKVERIASLIVDCEQKITELGDKLAHEKFELLMKLQALPLDELHRRILNYRYVACLTFGRISKLLNCSAQYIGRLHGCALRSLGLS